VGCSAWRGRSRPAGAPDLLPLLDVIFLVLAAFVIASMDLVERRALGLDLAEARSAERIDGERGVTLRLTRSGEVWVEDRPVALEELGEETVTVLEARDGKEVVLAGDRAGRLGLVMEVLDHLRRAGIEEVSLEARRP